LLTGDCPSCDPRAVEGKGVALACITMRSGSVYKICNLEKRKYVKSFLNVGYWLSLLPVVPLIKAVVERFCCLSLPDLLKPQGPPNLFAAANLNSASSGETMRLALSRISQVKLSSIPSGLLNQSTPVAKLAMDALVSKFIPSATAPAQIKQVNGMSVDEAKTTLAAAGV